MNKETRKNNKKRRNLSRTVFVLWEAETVWFARQWLAATKPGLLLKDAANPAVRKTAGDVWGGVRELREGR